MAVLHCISCLESDEIIRQFPVWIHTNSCINFLSVIAITDGNDGLSISYFFRSIQVFDRKLLRSRKQFRIGNCFVEETVTYMNIYEF